MVLKLQGDQSGVYGLYLTRAQFEHTGVYECTALTTLHSDSRSAVLTVIGKLNTLWQCTVLNCGKRVNLKKMSQLPFIQAGKSVAD